MQKSLRSPALNRVWPMGIECPIVVPYAQELP
ncbi:hypothetical protein PS662_06058 [Pseudomonas fluorescens]|uniref:Uncharacterized protein n=1 Tax=Pseudomonas fluorescens TaxID=294 RepID=A0A5E6Y269_PSEFL|nr:hypothetical protein PS662_05213 [Pseudomonas fluorescens]VVN47908.1 hypothetical protein PS662_06058 [Pseudomonas fluorescens]